MNEVRDRQDFEAWTKTFTEAHHYPLERDAINGIYVDNGTHHAWIGWHAARVTARYPPSVTK